MKRFFAPRSKRTKAWPSLLWTRMALCFLVLTACFPEEVIAHGDASVTPGAMWEAWNWDPTVLLALVLLSGIYLRGVFRLWKRAGVGEGIQPWQVVAFMSGIAAFFVALVSPIEAMGSVLFSAHMVQHLTLILIAAPLLVLGVPVLAMLWSLPSSGRQAVGRWWNRSRIVQKVWHIVSHPMIVWVFYAATIWLWHTPGPYQAALRNSFLHEVEHLLFIIASGLLCWVLVNPMGRRRLSRGMGVLYLFTTSLHGSLLGALITFSPSPWYEEYVNTTTAWGLSPLEDQQLAGLIMWVPMGIFYTSLAALLFVIWLRDMKSDARPSNLSLIPAIHDPRPSSLEGD